MENIYFNELSYSENIQNFEYTLIGVIKFLKLHGINKCKFTKDDINVFLQFKKENRILALSFFIIPFETSKENPAKEDIEYIQNEWLFEDKKTIGFSYAVNTGSFSLSFFNNGFDKSKYEVHKNKEIAEVYNISNEKNYKEIEIYIENNKEIELIKSNLSIEEKRKKSKLPSDHHHGTAELEKYIINVLRIPYVEYIINSTTLKKSNAKFVSYDQNKQAIIVRLIWENGNPGYVIKSTGRNEKECIKIVDYLNQNLPKYKQER